MLIQAWACLTFKHSNITYHLRLRNLQWCAPGLASFGDLGFLEFTRCSSGWKLWEKLIGLEEQSASLNQAQIILYHLI